MNAVLTGFGTAFPDAVEQNVLWADFFRDHFNGSRLAERIFASASAHRRHTVANPVKEDLTEWSTGERMRRYAAEAPPLGQRAVADALAQAGIAASEVGLLVVVSCTGYSTPGLDIKLLEAFDFQPDTKRLLVGHMGCYAALPALDSAAAFVMAQHRPAVLVCVELTSLHIQPPTSDPEQIVSHALFGDAAAAVVLQPRPAPGSGLVVVDIASVTDLSTSDHMTWDITDLGFRMGLSRAVPDVLARHLEPAVDRLLLGNGLRREDVAAWAVHPGGPRILRTVEEALQLPPEALQASRQVLADCGNCSSATVLLVLERLLREGGLRAGQHVLGLAFGPGLTLYAALLRCADESGG